MQWTIRKTKLSELKEYHKNPRKLTKKQLVDLKKSIKTFGLCEPIVANLDNTVIGGHQRIRVMSGMGIEEADVYFPAELLTEKQVEELNVRLNRNTGEWDYDILANQWDLGELIEWGFEENELSIDIEQIESEEEETEQLEPSKDPKTKLGDLYLLGEHRLCCGDSTNPDDVKKLLDGEEPVLMVTDPPYGVNYDPEWRGKSGKGCRAIGKVKNDDKINWALAWHLFPGSVAYVWHAGKYCSEVQKSLEEAEFEIISQIIWVKQHFALSRGDYHWQHEPCWYANKKGSSHNWQGSRKESTVWEISNLSAFGKSSEEDERTSHSTQKPLKCMSIPIENNSAEGEGIYDPFSGSGTTLIASDRLKRKSYCMELDPAYCDVIVDRWIKEKNKMNEESTVVLNGQEIEWKKEEEK